MTARAAIFGCSGPVLLPDERRFLADSQPWGFILFARNLDTPDQIRALTADLRGAVGRHAPILIDQEGGRVQRLRPPRWTGWQDALPFVRGFATPGAAAEAMRLRYGIIAAELFALGIDVNCAPMADLAQDHTHAVVRDRCYGTEPGPVADLARAVAEGLAAGGVLPVLKHIPGHGRTPLDSHADLPVVDTARAVLDATDFAAFRALADLPMAMTAHVVYTALDPVACATLSPTVIAMIRDDIGFGGLLMTDDLSMHALSGGFADRVTAALAAGCDMILHCNGDRHEMAQVAAATPLLAGAAARRADAALAARTGPGATDIPAALARIADLQRAGADA